MFDQVLSRGSQGIGALSQPLATAAKWLIIVGIAYTIGMTGLYFLSGEDETQAEATRGAQLEPTQNPPTVDVNAIVSRHLFGIADAQPVAAKKQVAVVTRLPLELQAVFVADDEHTQQEEHKDPSSAIIAERGKGGLLYMIGDSVPGNASLVDVQSDHVILSRAGARERLNFPQTDRQFTTDSSDDESAAADASWQEPSIDYTQSAQADAENSAPYDSLIDESATPEEIVEAYQEQIDENPDELLSDLGVETVQGGGYRIGSLAQAPYLSQTGLQPGDVIMSVNGEPVGDVQTDRARLTQVLEQGRARIEVQRGTRRFFVTTSLK